MVCLDYKLGGKSLDDGVSIGDYLSIGEFSTLIGLSKTEIQNKLISIRPDILYWNNTPLYMVDGILMKFLEGKKVEISKSETDETLESMIAESCISTNNDAFNTLLKLRRVFDSGILYMNEHLKQNGNTALKDRLITYFAGLNGNNIDKDAFLDMIGLSSEELGYGIPLSCSSDQSRLFSLDKNLWPDMIDRYGQRKLEEEKELKIALENELKELEKVWECGVPVPISPSDQPRLAFLDKNLWNDLIKKYEENNPEEEIPSFIDGVPTSTMLKPIKIEKEENEDPVVERKMYIIDPSKYPLLKFFDKMIVHLNEKKEHFFEPEKLINQKLGVHSKYVLKNCEGLILSDLKDGILKYNLTPKNVWILFIHMMTHSAKEDYGKDYFLRIKDMSPGIYSIIGPIDEECNSFLNRKVYAADGEYCININEMVNHMLLKHCSINQSEFDLVVDSIIMDNQVNKRNLEIIKGAVDIKRSENNALILNGRNYGILSTKKILSVQYPSVTENPRGLIPVSALSVNKLGSYLGYAIGINSGKHYVDPDICHPSLEFRDRVKDMRQSLLKGRDIRYDN